MQELRCLKMILLTEKGLTQRVLSIDSSRYLITSSNSQAGNKN
jgi:hypothetical protein